MVMIVVKGWPDVLQQQAQRFTESEMVKLCVSDEQPVATKLALRISKCLC